MTNKTFDISSLDNPQYNLHTSHYHYLQTSQDVILIATSSGQGKNSSILKSLDKGSERMSFPLCHLFWGVWSSPADAQCSPALKDCTVEGALGKGGEKLKEQLKINCSTYSGSPIYQVGRLPGNLTSDQGLPGVRHCCCQQTPRRWSPLQGPLQIDQCSHSPSEEPELGLADQHFREP